jgi:hypothetical protein
MKATTGRLSSSFAIALAMLLWMCPAGYAATRTETVSDLWPIAAALKEIEGIYLLPITYEDVPRIKQWERAPDDKGHQVEKSETLSFTYEELPDDVEAQIRKAETPVADDTLPIRKKLAAKAIEDLLRNYNQVHGDEECFTVTESDTGFHVVPKLFTDESGHAKPYGALLDTPISLPSAPRTIRRFLNDLQATLIVATGQEMYERGPTPNICDTVTISAANEPARSVLERFAQQVPVGYSSTPNKGGGVRGLPSYMSWQLICAPSEQAGCSLVLHTVTPKFDDKILLRGQPMFLGPPCGARN